MVQNLNYRANMRFLWREDI